jgi:hypothetical protein
LKLETHNFGSMDREIKNLKRELEVLLYRNDSAMFFQSERNPQEA